VSSVFNEIYEISSVIGKVCITSLNSHFMKSTLPQDLEKKKGGAKNSAFSELKPRYCSLVSRARVWIKVCNMQSQRTTGRLHLITLYIYYQMTKVAE